MLTYTCSIVGHTRSNSITQEVQASRCLSWRSYRDTLSQSKELIQKTAWPYQDACTPCQFFLSTYGFSLDTDLMLMNLGVFLQEAHKNSGRGAYYCSLPLYVGERAF